MAQLLLLRTATRHLLQAWHCAKPENPKLLFFKKQQHVE
jgi:hypothetical protein